MAGREEGEGGRREEGDEYGGRGHNPLSTVGDHVPP